MILYSCTDFDATVKFSLNSVTQNRFQNRLSIIPILIQAKNGIMTPLLRTRANGKAKVRQCLGFLTADIWSSLDYESAEQKPKHFQT